MVERVAEREFLEGGGKIGYWVVELGLLVESEFEDRGREVIDGLFEVLSNKKVSKGRKVVYRLVKASAEGEFAKRKGKIVDGTIITESHNELEERGREIVERLFEKGAQFKVGERGGERVEGMIEISHDSQVGERGREEVEGFVEVGLQRKLANGREVV